MASQAHPRAGLPVVLDSTVSLMGTMAAIASRHSGLKTATCRAVSGFHPVGRHEVSNETVALHAAAVVELWSSSVFTLT
jgi:hypothetical protein